MCIRDRVPLHDLPLSEEEACLAGGRGVLKDVKAPGLDSSSWRRERLQGYLTVLTINNVVRELVGGAGPEERGGVPQVLERRLGGPPGLMKNFKLRLSPITAVSHFFRQ